MTYVTEPASAPAAVAAGSAGRFRQGAGRLCLDFVRTLRYRGTSAETEELPDFAAIAAWVAQCGPCGAVQAGPDLMHPDAAEHGTRRVRALREAVYELIQAGRSPGGVAAGDPAARDLVNAAAALPVPVPGIDVAGTVRWTAGDPIAATLALLARDAIDLATGDLIGRVRGCASPQCGALFCDTSRPGSRRWCSMDPCGNRAKKTALRARAPRSSSGEYPSPGGPEPARDVVRG